MAEPLGFSGVSFTRPDSIEAAPARMSARDVRNCRSYMSFHSSAFQLAHLCVLRHILLRSLKGWPLRELHRLASLGPIGRPLSAAHVVCWAHLGRISPWPICAASISS